MSFSVFLRGISYIVARLVLGSGRAGNPTERWQDKSRSLRRGRAVEECWNIKRFVRGATARDSLAFAATPWRLGTNRTSIAPAP